MLIDHIASAGTLESSDIMITIEPGTNGIELTLTSPVIQQYGKHIRKTITDTLHRLGVATPLSPLLITVPWTALSKPAQNVPFSVPQAILKKYRGEISYYELKPQQKASAALHAFFKLSKARPYKGSLHIRS